MPQNTTNVFVGGQIIPSWTVPPGTGANPVYLTPTVQVFTSSGTYTPTAGMQFCIIECVGGGGAGGNCTGSASFAFGGGGGGSGQYSVALYISAATIGTSQSVTVGAGGIAVVISTSGSTGGSGGITNVGSICSAAGGIGGHRGLSGAVATGGLGGNSGIGTVLVPGTPGGVGAGDDSNAQAWSGKGGDSKFGAGGLAIITNSGAAVAGNAGLGYGAGGGGASVYNASASALGGNGSAGIVIIQEF